MLLLHTVGSVKIGEIVRYTVTYTPSQDEVFPISTDLYLRIKNTAALPLRAAYLHGPYTIYVSVRRQEFHPYEPWYEHANVDSEEGIEAPMYDPHLKAGASFYAALRVPEKLRQDAMQALHSADQLGKQDNVEVSPSGLKELIEGNVSAQGMEVPRSVTWIIEIISQTIFSTSAMVGFEVMLARDEKSLSYGFPFGPANYANLLGGDDSNSKRQNGTEGKGGKSGHGILGPGILSGAIKLKVQDTADLWNLPPFPSWSDEESESSFPTNKQHGQNDDYPDPDDLDEQEAKRVKDEERRRRKRKTKKVHLVMLTHGLHSNTGADMLFMKEVIDEEERKIEASWEKRKDERSKTQSDRPDNTRMQDEEDEREMLIVRGFHGNVCRTERGIRYLGKRLAEYVISLVDPKEPNPHPLQKSQSPSPQPPPRTPNKLRKHNVPHRHLTPAARALTSAPVKQKLKQTKQQPYKVTSISFIGHSLGGLVQTYAIAWIHAHHPNFFRETKPVNFVALATPFLGLSNENPIYVKFALSFGLVGRTGQDLGLAWRAPDMATSLSSAFTSGDNSLDKLNGGKADTSKPLLRILPAGPAHEVLKMFMNRTVYANVVNDGIVPLRTSCLLFLDWKGLGRVERARRENAKTAAEQVAGLVGWGISQLTSNTSTSRTSVYISGNANKIASTSEIDNEGGQDTGIASLSARLPLGFRKLDDETIMEAPLTAEMTERERIGQSSEPVDSPTSPTSNTEDNSASSAQNNIFPNALSSILTLLRPQGGKKQDKTQKMMKRTQTLRSQIAGSDVSSFTSIYSVDQSPVISRAASPMSPTKTTKAMPNIISSYDDFDDPVFAPPKTTILETAGDLLNPPLPPVDFIVDPNSRPMTIFHDRVYHSWEIPLPFQKQHKHLPGVRKGEPNENANSNKQQSEDDTNGDTVPSAQTQSSINGEDGTATNEDDGKTFSQPAPMKVEEKIARAYHKDMSWRKVLVKLEPDAHNNLIVRRMFANAYGWPVVRHLVDTHFGIESKAAQIPDSEEGTAERAGEHGDVVGGVKAGIGKEKEKHITIDTSANEDELRLRQSIREPRSETDDSGLWTDTAFDVTEYEDDESETEDISFDDGECIPKQKPRKGWATVTSVNESDSFLGREPKTSLDIPTREVSRIDAFGRSADCSSSSSTIGKFKKADVEEHKGRTYDVGVGRSSAMRELARVNSKSSSKSVNIASDGENAKENGDTI